jgi:hypothetical protein
MATPTGSATTPVVATRADTGEVLHVRLRKGAANTQRGTVRFVEELVARVRRAGASGELIMRFDSGFWSNATIATLERLDVGFTMGVRMIKVRGQRHFGHRRVGLDPDRVHQRRRGRGGRVRVQGTPPHRAPHPADRTPGHLWPQWRHFAFLTDLEGHPVDVDAFHRDHANVELAIRDLKEGAGLEHVPSGQFFANAAWLVCAALAHDLIRWTAMLGEITPEDQRTVARTVRTRYFSVPGRLVSRSGWWGNLVPGDFDDLHVLPHSCAPFTIGSLGAGGTGAASGLRRWTHENLRLSIVLHDPPRR